MAAASSFRESDTLWGWSGGSSEFGGGWKGLPMAVRLPISRMYRMIRDRVHQRDTRARRWHCTGHGSFGVRCDNGLLRFPRVVSPWLRYFGRPSCGHGQQAFAAISHQQIPVSFLPCITFLVPSFALCVHTLVCYSFYFNATGCLPSQGLPSP